jgi:LmbE family N-acetylglucosaminyl deacetylase
MSMPGDLTVDDLLSRRLLIVAPHMDDEVLGCGGSMLRHTDKTRIHCVYATDGARSPAPLLPWIGSIDPGIKELRRREAHEVMGAVGIPPDNLVFLDLPDGKLSRNATELKTRLETEMARIAPSVILIPFRYDLHPDHVAVNRCVRRAVRESPDGRVLLEYFIYFRWRLVKAKDIRRTIPESHLLNVDIASVAAKKSAAIRLYRSQTSILGDWQERPILTAQSIAKRCSEPETFLRSDPGQPLSAIFSDNRIRILLAHYAERMGKRRKDQVRALLKWVLGPRRK